MSVSSKLPLEDQRPMTMCEPESTASINGLTNPHSSQLPGGPQNPLQNSLSQIANVQKQSLPKSITKQTAVSLIVGTIIGTGIFMSPKTITEQVGSIGWTLVIWVACGLYSLFGSLTYLELGLMIKKSGAEYSYLTYTYGSCVGYVLIFINLFILRPVSQAMVSLTFADYITSSYDIEDPSSTSQSQQVSHASKVLFALALIWGSGIVNMFSTRAGLKMQTIFFYLKLTLCAMIIFAGLVGVLKRGNEGHLNSTTFWANSTASPSTLALAFYGGLWPYEGWNSLNYMTEEVVNPEKTMSFAILLSVFAVTGIYLLINLSYFFFLTTEQIREATAIAVTFGQTAFKSRLLHVTIPIFVFLSAAGSYNGGLLTASRLFMVAGRDGIIPPWYALASRTTSTPIVSIFCMSVLTSLYILPSSANFDNLVGLFSFTNLFFYGTTYLAVAWLRKLEPIKERPFKIWLVIPLTMALCSYGLVLIPLVAQPRFEYFYVLGFFGLAMLCYYVLFYRGVPAITIMNSRFENFLIKKFNLARVASEYTETMEGIANVQSTYTRFDDD